MTDPLKRFVVFAGDEYYPTGGWGDFFASFDDLDVARQRGLQAKSESGELFDWYQVVDITVGAVLYWGLCQGQEAG